jgi:hypothetical protein
MVSFKTFLKIRYPEWENTILSFEPPRYDALIYTGSHRMLPTQGGASLATVAPRRWLGTTYFEHTLSR